MGLLLSGVSSRNPSPGSSPDAAECSPASSEHLPVTSPATYVAGTSCAGDRPHKRRELRPLCHRAMLQAQRPFPAHTPVSPCPSTGDAASRSLRHQANSRRSEEGIPAEPGTWQETCRRSHFLRPRPTASSQWNGLIVAERATGFRCVLRTGFLSFHRAKVAPSPQRRSRNQASSATLRSLLHIGFAVKFVLASVPCSCGNFPRQILDRPGSVRLPALRNKKLNP